MSATPGATDEYSRGSAGFRAAATRDSGPGREAGKRPAAGRSAPLAPRASRLILGAVLLGAALLVAAEFTTLYQAHLATKLTPIKSVTAGSHNSYAMVPIALLAAVLAMAVWRSGNRLALLAIGVLGVVALLIALLHDLPDTHAMGLANNNSVNATTTPRVGLYLETLGAILLIATTGLAFMTIGLPGWRRAAGPERGGAAGQ